MSSVEEQALAAVARARWLWRGVTALWAAGATAVALRLRRESLDPVVLRGDEDALRRACLGFPLPVMLGGSRTHDFRDADSGTRSLSYRLPAARSCEEVHAYYDDYLRRSGFAPAGGSLEAERAPTEPTKAYRDADGLRAASVSVHTEPLRGDYRTVVVTVRPIHSMPPPVNG